MTSIEQLRENALKEAKKKIKESVSKDLMIINAINNIEELDKSTNIIVSRLREWFSLSNPELEKKYSDNEVFVKKALEELNGKKTPTEMGAEFDNDDKKAVVALAKSATDLVVAKKELEVYLSKAMESYCKNINFLAGTTIGARLIREAKGLKRLASLGASTVQLLGAEKALFRHIKSGTRPPKYGHIVNHQIIMNAKHTDKGKAARALADKLSICARLDYFKGDFMADKYSEELRKKFN